MASHLHAYTNLYKVMPNGGGVIEYVLLGIAIFWLILTGLVKHFHLEERGVTILPLVLVMMRTRRFLSAVDTLAEKGKRFWNAYATVGVAVSVVGIPVSLGYFVWNAYKVLSRPQEAAAVIPVIPGVTIKLTWGLILSIVIIFFAHEFSHGIVAIREGIPLKSMGILLLFIVPGAFVEPDEEELKKAPRLTRMKIYSAGSLGNFIVAALFLIPLLLIPQIPDGVLIYDTIAGTPAAGVIPPGSVIYQINGVDVKTAEAFSQQLSIYHPGDTIVLGTSEGAYTITLAQHPSNPSQGYIGIHPLQHVKYFTLLDTFSWIFMLNLSVALFNLFPISRILDGGKITDEILNRFFSERTSRRLSAAFVGAAFVILLINLLSSVIT